MIKWNKGSLLQCINAELKDKMTIEEVRLENRIEIRLIHKGKAILTHSYGCQTRSEAEAEYYVSMLIQNLAGDIIKSGVSKIIETDAGLNAFKFPPVIHVLSNKE